MPKFIINWDSGYGESHDVIEADTLDEANAIAYDQWRDEAESYANYGAEEYNEELAEEYGLE